MKTIAVDIDNTLNNFMETLINTEFPYDKEKYSIDEATFKEYLVDIKAEKERDEDKYNNLSAAIHRQAYTIAKPRPGAAKFMRQLKNDGWRIVIMTYRDLRGCLEDTKEWFKKYKIPYDYFFRANDKIVMCKAWDIKTLIDDEPYNIIYGEEFGIQVYYPVMEKHKQLPPTLAKGFNNFEEVAAWIK